LNIKNRSGDSYGSPCGGCRQFIAEFGLDWDVIMVKNENDYIIQKVSDILPYAFDKSSLDKNNNKSI
jgi:cytidine deaminase